MKYSIVSKKDSKFGGAPKNYAEDRGENEVFRFSGRTRLF